MRVLNIMFGKSQGGLERVTLDYANALKESGFEVLTIGAKTGWLATQFEGRSDFVGLRVYGNYGLITQLQMSRLCSKFKPDCILAHGTRAMHYASRIAGPSRIGILHNTRFKSVMSKMDALIAVSDGVAGKARERFNTNVIHIVPNSTVIPHLPPRRTAPSCIRIGAIGRFHHRKGFDLLISALARPDIMAMRWTLRLAGSGEEEGKLKVLAKELILEDRIEFTGWINEPADFFRQIDLFIMPSREEPFGLVLIEAMAYRLPVIATDTDGPTLILTNGEDGLIVRRDDVDSLSDAIIQALTHFDTLDAMAERGRKKIEEQYNSQLLPERLKSTIAHVLTSRRGGNAPV